MAKKIKSEFSSHNVGVAAEAFAAGALAHAGYDVSIQYGANRPGYDIVATDPKKPDRVLRVSVKGSKKGGWGLSQPFKRGRTYRKAADEWLKRNPNDLLLFMLVHLENTPLGTCPDIYVARPKEIADELKNARNGYGATYITVLHTYKSGVAKGVTDKIPSQWKLSQERIDSV